jgi:hypothetical protein
VFNNGSSDATIPFGSSSDLTREIGKSPWNLGKKVANKETHVRMIFVDEVNVTRQGCVSCQNSPRLLH